PAPTPRLPPPHGHHRRPQRYPRPQTQRPQAARRRQVESTQQKTPSSYGGRRDRSAARRHMQKERRLRRRKDFAAAYRTGRVYGNQLLILRIAPNGGQVTRFGFVTGKAVGNAVARNRVKRRLRAAARALEAPP